MRHCQTRSRSGSKLSERPKLVSYQNPSSGRLLVPVAILSQAQKSEIFVDLELQTIRVTGPEDLIVTVAQQLAWLVAGPPSFTRGAGIFSRVVPRGAFQPRPLHASIPHSQ